MGQIFTQVLASWPWYVVRAAGFVAAGLIFMLMLSGIGLVTGYTFRFIEPIKAWAIHRALGIALGVSILVHMVVLLLDKFVTFNLGSLLVPFAASFKPLWTGFGVLAMYCLALVIITSLVVIDRSRKVWKISHYASYAAVALVFLHALFSGTDLAAGPLRWVWMIGGLVIATAVVSRLYRAGTLRRQPPQ